MSLPENFNPDAPSEAASPYNGVFSWAGESHAFTIGVGVGVTGEKELMLGFVGYAIAGGKADFEASDDPHIKQVAQEPAYAIGGLVIGFALNHFALGKPAHEFIPQLMEWFPQVMGAMGAM